MTLATILVLAAEETEHSGNVALETIGYGITALAIFGALALVTVSYRNVANRHSRKAEAYAKAHANDVQRAGHGH
jgi:divalent metal cation (Fe/Co/Zn/Cd) transporter